MEAYTQVIKCNSENKPRRFCLAIQQCVSRSSKNYYAFLKVLKEKLDKKQSVELLPKSSSTLKQALFSFGRLSGCEGLQRSFSEPTISKNKPRPKIETSFSVNERPGKPSEQERPDELDSDSGLQFKISIQCSEESADLAVMNEQYVKPVEEVGEAREMVDDKNVLPKHKKLLQNGNTVSPQVNLASSSQSMVDTGDERRDIILSLTRLQHLKFDCKQNEAKVLVLNKQVDSLKDKLSSAHNENNRLTLKLQRQLEEIESLRRKQNKKILALSEKVQGNERLKARVAEAEMERNAEKEKVDEIRTRSEEDRSDFRRRAVAITTEYEQKIKVIDSARRKVQNRLDKVLDEEIPKLQRGIIEKEIQIYELNQTCRRVYDRLRFAFDSLFIILFVFLVFLCLYVIW